MQVTYPASKLQQAFHAIVTGAQRHILLSLLVFRIKFLAGFSEKGQGVIERERATESDAHMFQPAAVPVEFSFDSKQGLINESFP